MKGKYPEDWRNSFIVLIFNIKAKKIHKDVGTIEE